MWIRDMIKCAAVAKTAMTAEMFERVLVLVGGA